MALEMKGCVRTGMEYFETAPVRIETRRTLHCTPEELFASFADASHWPRWVPPIEHVEWTSPGPVGLGSTRRVKMPGGIVGEEEFIAWDPGKEMAFIFSRTNVPVESFAERYVVEPRGPRRSEVTWTLCMTPTGPSVYSVKALAQLMERMNHWMLGRLDRLIEYER